MGSVHVKVHFLKNYFARTITQNENDKKIKNLKKK